MKAIKKFLIYFFSIIGIVAILFGGFFAFLYFSHGSSLFGFKYIAYSETKTNEYTISTDLSVDNVNSVEIATINQDIYVFPNEQSKTIKIVQVQNFSGFTKIDNSYLTTDFSVEDKYFEESNTQYHTFIVDIIEPTGWVSKNDSHIEVYVSADLLIDTFYLKSSSGNIYYNSSRDIVVNDENPQEDEEEIIIQTINMTCNDLYVQTHNNGKVFINNKQSIDKYFITTQNGETIFNCGEKIDASLIKFSTAKGDISFSNSKNNFSLNSEVIINSTSSKNGSKIDIDILNGNLTANIKSGNITIDKMGSEIDYTKTIAITASRVEINLGEIYGYLSILSGEGKIKNTLNIQSLNTNYSQIDILELGAGNLYIANLNANITGDLSTGNSTINNVSNESNINLYSTSGDFNISYISSENSNTDILLKLITETGNINLNNVSCSLNLKVKNSSSNKNLNISFTSISKTENIIEAFDRKVNITTLGTSDDLQSRILSTCPIDLVQPAVGAYINNEDNDYISLSLEKYKKYQYQFRYAYNKEGVGEQGKTYKTYDFYGILLISSSAKIKIISQW